MAGEGIAHDARHRYSLADNRNWERARAEALEIVRGLIVAVTKDGNPVAIDPHELLTMVSGRVGRVRIELSTEVSKKNAGRLTKMAKRRGDYWEIVCDTVANMLEHGHLPPPALAKFAAQALRLPSAKPRRRGPALSGRFFRDLIISMICSGLLKQGFYPLYRNEVSAPHSICDLVAAELKVSYSTVQKVCTWYSVGC